MAKITLKENRAGGVILPDFKAGYEATLTKTTELIIKTN
jgi:hypothetical protein